MARKPTGPVPRFSQYPFMVTPWEFDVDKIVGRLFRRVSGQPIEKDGKHVGTRTPDLYRHSRGLTDKRRVLALQFQP